MASPDPTKFASSSQIFSTNYTLPQIRAIHRSLHVEIEDKASRLRTQVGSSYRDLLGTADTIVQMRGHNDAVQDLLGKMGWRCGREVISTKTSGLASFSNGRSERNADVAEAARKKLLDGCFLVVGRILKGKGQVDSGMSVGDRLVLATRVWLLSRLLVKNLGAGESHEAKDGDARRLAEAENRKTLDSLRRRLRRALKNNLARVGDEADRDGILKALCAHSLANSSGARDALRYFFEVRSSAMAMAFEAAEEEQEGGKNEAGHVLLAFKLFTQTLLDVQALVPGKLAQTLRALKENPLLREKSLQQLEVLRLDICARWCSDEIQYFTPYIRHDDLEGAHAHEVLASWAEKGREVLLANLKKTLADMTDFKSVMELRTRILQLWIRQSGKIKGLDSLEMQAHLREVVNSRMLAVLEGRVSRLELVASEIRDTLDNWQNGATGRVANLWDETGYDEALSRGAAPFMQEVATRFYGRGAAVCKAADLYTSWFKIIGVVEGMIETLRKQRWDNDYEEVEDEETIEARQQLLSREDPKMLQEKLDTTLDQSFRKLEEGIRARWEEEGREGRERGGQAAMYLLRVLRDIRGQLPERDGIQKFGLAVVPSLHEKIAAHVSGPPVVKFTSTGRLLGDILGGRILWEGNPPLPSQPSSEVFQFLRDLSAGMADAGIDLWTTPAVNALKSRVSGELCTAWEKELAEAEAGAENEAKQQRDGTTQDKDEAPQEKAEERKETEEEDSEEKEAAKEDKEAEMKAEELEKNREEKEAEQNDDQAEERRKKAKDMYIQWLFDIVFLRCSIGSGTEEEADGLARLGEVVFQRSGLQDSSRQRISKSARTFRERTSLLFGVLA